MTFYNDMGKKPTKKHSLDRIDGNGNYEPSNCRWATRTEQNRNKNNNHRITYNGETLTVVEWAERMGMKNHTLQARINNYGLSIEEAITRPVK